VEIKCGATPVAFCRIKLKHKTTKDTNGTKKLRIKNFMFFMNFAVDRLICWGEYGGGGDGQQAL
jgi:hypothetical protein